MGGLSKKALEAREKMAKRYKLEPSDHLDPYGVCAIVGIMVDLMLPYDSALFDITIPLVKRYNSKDLIRYRLETTGQVLMVMDFIKEKKLLDGKGVYSDTASCS